MSLEVDVADYLLSQPSVTARVGQRIYQLILPQLGAYPAIRVQLITKRHPKHLRGRQGLFRGIVQIDVYDQATSGGAPYDTVDLILAAIEAVTEEPVLIGSPPKKLVFIEDDEGAMYEPGEQRLVRKRRDYAVWEKEAA